MRPIQLMIAGAPKAATTSLLRYLGQNPGVCIHEQLEMGYFVKDTEYARGYEHAFKRYFEHGYTETCLVFAKSVQIMYMPEALDRLRKHNPDIHVVLSLRNPVDRAYSEYWFARRRGWEDIKTFEEAVRADPKRFGSDQVRRRGCAYLDRGLYVEYLARVMEYFAKERIHVFLFRDIRCDAIKISQSLYSLFDELDPTFPPQINQSHNAAAMPCLKNLAHLLSSPYKFPLLKRVFRRLFTEQLADKVRDTIMRANEREFAPPPMNLETRMWLINYFKPYNIRLSELLGCDLSHWYV